MDLNLTYFHCSQIQNRTQKNSFRMGEIMTDIVRRLKNVHLFSYVLSNIMLSHVVTWFEKNKNSHELLFFLFQNIPPKSVFFKVWWYKNVNICLKRNLQRTMLMTSTGDRRIFGGIIDMGEIIFHQSCLVDRLPEQP